jgi:hypothetical protein
MALLYLAMKKDIEHFAGFDPGGLTDGAAGILNRATRRIVNMYEGRWKHLYRREQSVTVDSTGYYITLPSDINHIHFLALRDEQEGQFRRETDYYLETSSPSVLTSAPTKKLRFWRAHNPSSTMYMNYWRLVLTFSDSSTEQYPDIPESGEAILAMAKYICLNESRAPMAEQKDYLAVAIREVRDLKAKDGGYDVEEAAIQTHVNTDPFQAPNYSPQSGGRVTGSRAVYPSADGDSTL